VILGIRRSAATPAEILKSGQATRLFAGPSHTFGAPTTPRERIFEAEGTDVCNAEYAHLGSRGLPALAQTAGRKERDFS